VAQPYDFVVATMTPRRCIVFASTRQAKQWCDKNMFFAGKLDIERRRIRNIVVALRAEGFQLPPMLLMEAMGEDTAGTPTVGATMPEGT
jgi:hypothetical protein